MHHHLNADLARIREQEVRVLARRPDRLMAGELTRSRTSVRSRRTR